MRIMKKETFCYSVQRRLKEHNKTTILDEDRVDLFEILD